MKMNVKQLTTTALLTALVCIATMVIQIPVMGTQGYIHLGDSIILIAAVFFGWRCAAIAGGFGSMLADILSGYAHWAVFTLIIKAVLGALVGLIAARGVPKQNDGITGLKAAAVSCKNIFAVIAGELWMVFGYFVAGAILKSSFIISLTSVPENLIQGIGGIIIYAVLGVALRPVFTYTGSIFKSQS